MKRLEEILLSNSIDDYQEEILKIIPELELEIGFDQKSEWHSYDVWNHTIVAINNCDDNVEDRLVLLLHDIGKPFSYQEENGIRHFKGHAEKSAEISVPILKRLGIENEELINLIKEHSTTIDINSVNKDNIDYYLRLLKIQKCDSKAYEKRHSLLILEKLNKLEKKIKSIDIL